MTDRPVSIKPTRYTVTCLPHNHPEVYHYSLTLEFRGQGKWAICRAGDGCYNAFTGQFDHESVPSERADEWKRQHRFTLKAARIYAMQLAPGLTVNGHTVEDALMMWATECSQLHGWHVTPHRKCIMQ